ncbi:ATP-binding protein [uncultured Roseobacter sp.]|uniref:YobI family P-loop NTPase n=1 Tax=uncultured Roseobacter sp. TaxID=114847 RepID=UPI00260EF15C|nr:ATP-binding protein [uncultured Roseobacter sp.]
MIVTISRLIAFARSWFSQTDRGSSEYVDLAPTDKADESGIYSHALTYATNNPNVSNIALTGPYGSGKSSIIKTFLTVYRRPTLQISLAAFLPEAVGLETKGERGGKSAKKGSVSKQEIERSILQQMLYGADANSLPLSRFKRIKSPKWWSSLVSLFIVLGAGACWYLIQQRAELLDGSFFKPFDHTNWFNLLAVALAFLVIWQALHHLYIKSFGISLKSISLKDMEIATEAAEEESILNRHLDEIIYFFQSTAYDLVVIEDLDRFNNPDIFVTLREINSLINANSGVKRQIRFLYALRDNMFVNTDRTKFFEFIVPVIPIINSSNSIDKVIEQGERLSLDERLNRQFLREVSRHLNDLRLIQNIFNEYAIYVKNLETDDENILDPNKLLAILIYKNVLPSDFEDLHREKGKLAGILNRHDALISSAERRYKAQISDLEQQIVDAEKQVPSDLGELRQIYAMALLTKLPAHYTVIVGSGNQRIPIKDLSASDQFDDLIEQNNIMIGHTSSPGNRQNLDISGLQNEVNSDKSYQERKQAVERRSAEHKANSSKTIRQLRAQIAGLRTTKFNEILRADASETKELFDAFGENRELVRFLVFEGFLDDTYYQYTSLFHSGRLSPNDNKFLIQIRAFNLPEPDFQIDNPKEVIAAMRDDDFGQSFVLNTILVDCLLSDTAEYSEQLTRMTEFVSRGFDQCNDFFSSYYERGRYVGALLSTLIDAWPNFIATAITSPDSIRHMARLLADLPAARLKSLAEQDMSVSEFISANLAEVLALGVDIEPEQLRRLPLEVHDLPSIEPYPAVARLLVDEGLYSVSIENLVFAFRDVLGLPNADGLQNKHYSTLLASKSEPLINLVEEDFHRYLTNILLELDDNTEEEIATIIKALCHDEIENEHLEEFIVRQSNKLPSLDNIPTRFHVPIIRLNKIEPSWDNCLAFVTSEVFDASTLTSFLEQEDTLEELSDTLIDRGDTASPLRQFIFNNNGFEDETYRAYLQALPNRFRRFPDDVEVGRTRILIEEDAVTYSKSTHDHLSAHDDLQVLFTARNIENYFKQTDEIALDDEFREKLLSSHVTDEQKLKVANDMDLTSIVDMPERASILAELFHRTGTDLNHLPSEAAQAIILNAKPVSVQVLFLNKLRNTLSYDQVKQTIQTMPDPFPDIKPGWQQPRLSRSEANIELVEWLTERGVISSWKETIWGDIRIYNVRS